MTAAVEQVLIEHELAAIRLQQAELQAEQDGLLAERFAMALSLGINVEDDQSILNAVLQHGLDVGALRQLDVQLAELRAAEGHLLAQSLQNFFSDSERAARESEVTAAALEAQERWKAQVAAHDAAFARKLARLDEHTWQAIGHELAEPLDLPMPMPMPMACAAPDSGAGPGPSNAGLNLLPRHHQATAAPGPRSNFTPNPSAAAYPPTATSHPSLHTQASLQRPSGPATMAGPVAQSSTGAGPSKAGPSGGAGAGAGPSVGPSTAAGPGPSSAAAAAAAAAVVATIECLCCFDRFPEDTVTCAGADAASSSTASAGCAHYFCSECLTQYVLVKVRERKYPIDCPLATTVAAAAGGAAGQQQRQRAQGCRLKFSRESVLAALERHPKEQQAYKRLEAEASLDPGQLLYCPHKACSSPLLKGDDMLPGQPVNCPACQRIFCPHCRIPGWHQGYTCAQFQALPAHLRSAEDAAVLQLSAKQQWKQCPQCKQMVERSEGCNHMLCRCGSTFCYKCGQPYKDTKPTPDNVHGTPACGCPLFDVPGDDDVDDGDEAEVNRGQRRPFRGGRLVRRRRCHHSASIYDCPMGPQKCWFWHDEDDDEY